jgi:hypothetical protein
MSGARNQGILVGARKTGVDIKPTLNRENKWVTTRPLRKRASAVDLTASGPETPIDDLRISVQRHACERCVAPNTGNRTVGQTRPDVAVPSRVAPRWGLPAAQSVPAQPGGRARCVRRGRWCAPSSRPRRLSPAGCAVLVSVAVCSYVPEHRMCVTPSALSALGTGHRTMEIEGGPARPLRRHFRSTARP